MNKEAQKILNDFGMLQNKIWHLEEYIFHHLLWFRKIKNNLQFFEVTKNFITKMLYDYKYIYKELGILISIFYHESYCNEQENQVIQKKINCILPDYNQVGEKIVKSLRMMLNNHWISENIIIGTTLKAYNKIGKVFNNEDFNSIENISDEIIKTSITFYNDCWKKQKISIKILN